MSSTTVVCIRCETCDVKIPKNLPKLRCSICSKFKRCQKLTKADAEYIIKLGTTWTFYECISNILPVNTGYVSTNSRAKPSGQKFKIKC